MNLWDVIVIGLGGVGSAAVFELAKRGLRVLGIDQYPPAHGYGSSHGQTRIVRQAYFEDPVYVPLLRRAYQLWDELDRLSEGNLFVKCGVLQMGPPDGVVVPGVLASSKLHSLPIEEIGAADVTNRWPGIHCDSDWAAVLERNAGFVHVEQCVRAHLVLAEVKGAVLRHNACVEKWNSGPEGVCVELAGERHFASKLVLTVGPWANEKIMPEFGGEIRVLKKHLFWFESNSNCYGLSAGMPCFFHETQNGYFYGFPQIDSDGVKLAMHSGGDMTLEPSIRDHDDAPLTEEYQHCDRYRSQFLDRLTDRLTKHQVCYYSMTPDENFMIGSDHGDDRVIVVCGLSGHGFKFTPVLGEIAAQMVNGERVPFNLNSFRLDRFTTDCPSGG